MDIVDIRKLCSDRPGRAEYCDIPMEEVKQLCRNKLYITKDFHVYLYLGKKVKSDSNVFLDLGCSVADIKKRKYRGKESFYIRMYDGNYRYGSGAIYSLLALMFLDSFDKNFIVSFKECPLFIGELERDFRTDPFAIVLLSRLFDSYVNGLSRGDYRSLANDSNTLLVKGASYKSEDYEEELLYLGMQLCKLKDNRMESCHLYLKMKDFRKNTDINKFIDKKASESTVNFLIDIDRDSLVPTNKYYKGILLDNNIAFGFKC